MQRQEANVGLRNQREIPLMIMCTITSWQKEKRSRISGIDIHETNPIWKDGSIEKVNM